MEVDGNIVFFNEAEAVAAQTLKEVKDAMKINYFDDKALIEAQAERFSK